MIIRKEQIAQHNRAASKGRIWPVIICSLIGGNMTICGITAYAAFKNGGAVIEPDYDRKAQNYEQTARQLQASQRLGWTARIDPMDASGRRPIAVTLIDAAGKPIDDADVKVVLFHRAHAKDVQAMTLSPQTNGRYENIADVRLGGAWEVRLTARSGSRYFIDKQVVYVSWGSDAATSHATGATSTTALPASPTNTLPPAGGHD